MTDPDQTPAAPVPADPPPHPEAADGGPPVEHGGPKGPEPTRYGDWTVKGRCIDF
ncbi:DUF1674 domain-containing protein [Rhizosaccharibacter radicis]